MAKTLALASLVFFAAAGMASKLNLSEIKRLTKLEIEGIYHGVNKDNELCYVGVKIEEGNAIDYASWRVYGYNDSAITDENRITTVYDLQVRESTSMRVSDFVVTRVGKKTTYVVETQTQPRISNIRHGSSEGLLGGVNTDLAELILIDGEFSAVTFVETKTFLRANEEGRIEAEQRERNYTCSELVKK